MTRIISGNFKGKQIRAPKKWEVRPTTDFAKESLFNILNNHYYFDEIEVLDLFAGTGNLSLEFISRGCVKVTAVDREGQSIRFIEKTAQEWQIENLPTHRSDALEYLKREYREYDLIIADPPYQFEDYQSLIETVFLRNLLKEDGQLIIEHSSRKDLSDLQNFQQVRKYGAVAFSFFYPEEA